jgi:hypothetical protein
VDGAWSSKNKSSGDGDAVTKQPAANRSGANVPDASGADQVFFSGLPDGLF